MKETTQKAYVEILELLKYFPIEQLKKIPKMKLDVFFLFRDKTYNYKVDKTKSFFEQDMMPETKAILTILFEDYWATDEQKKLLKQKEKEAFKELEDEKRNLYNPDNLFKNKKLTKTETHVENTDIALLKNNWYNKIIRFVQKIFKRKV